jgi:hypothetical protein
VDGKLPIAWNTLACCSGAVSQAASAVASAGCSVCLGTLSHEPPQLPPLPGTDATSQSPAADAAWSWM